MPLIALLLAVLVMSVGGRRLGRAVGNVGRSFRRATPDGAMSLRQAREVLGVDETASRQAVEAAYRRLMRRAHPDQGGSVGLASQLNAARQALIG